MTSNLQQSLSGLYEITKKLNQKFKNLEDYTAFEVYANDTTIPSGTHYYELPEDLKMYVPTDYLQNESLSATTLAGDIPANMTLKLTLRSDNDPSELTNIVDFGDGIISGISEATQSGDNFVFTHTYETKGKYTVKIFGDKYFNFYTSSISFGKGGSQQDGIVCRCLTDDLPIAKCVYNISHSFESSPSLFKIDFVFGSKICNRLTEIGNWSYTFINNCNCLIVKGFEKEKFESLFKNNFARTMEYTFLGNTNLRKSDFKLLPSKNYQYCYAFCENLNANIKDLLPSKFNYNSIDIGACFSGSSSLTGTIPANILWENPEIQWQCGSTFLNCSDAIRSQAPTSWGGTNEEIEAKLQAGYWNQSSDGVYDQYFETINQQIQQFKEQI